MKLPSKIIGRNKIRDAAICINWEELIEDKIYPTIESIKEALSKKFELTEARIYQIVRENHAYIPHNKEWEKKKRINRLKLEIKKKEASNKDVVDLMEQLRIEIEGNAPLIDQSQHFKSIVYHISTPKILNPQEENLINANTRQ